MSRKRLGEVLRERGQISADDLIQAIQDQQEKVLRLGELLLERGVVSKPDLLDALHEVTRIPYMDALAAEVTSEALGMIPRELALKHAVLPVRRERSKLVTIMAEPQNLHVLDALRFRAGAEISPRLGFRGEISAAIEKHYGADPDTENEAARQSLSLLDQSGVEMEFFSASSREAAQEAMKEFQAELLKQPTPAVRLVSALISNAASKQASDIHIEPQAGCTVVRFRIDGVLREIMQVTGKLQLLLVSRIKVLADMDIAERRAPQDGRFLVRLGQKKLDLRISTLPTQYGEKVVMRLLDSSIANLQFSRIGFSPEHCAWLSSMLTQPQGMLLVTGPTGSGKTTTLYAALNLVRSSKVNIVTVEDPIEYQIEGINQVQVNTKAGLTFANSLRSILRQDPNVIMVGEIRDVETAEIALKAAQTGHLVFSTLHTNDSIAAITRLLDLGTPAYMISSSVSAVIAQRLTRRLCPCRREKAATPEYKARLLAAGLGDGETRMLVPAGCSECDQTGYKGRVGVFEVLVLDEQMRNAIRSGARPDEIRSLARAAGMKMIQESALEKVKAGMTSLEEVLRVVAFEHSFPDPCPKCGKELVAGFLFCPYCGTQRAEAACPDRIGAREEFPVAAPHRATGGRVR